MNRRPSRSALALFGFGDFAFNLCWQSVMLYLLFFYTDVLMLPVAVAALVYTVASIWDGVVGFFIGIIADGRGSARHYGLALILGGPVLGLGFVLAYLPVARAIRFVGM